MAEPSAVETTSPGSPTQPSPADTEAESDAMSEALAEREAFLDAQQLPRDGTPLVAVTDAQKQLVTEQRAWSESQGATWTPQDESIVLALAADACESAILNQHVIDGAFLMTVVTNSPLVQQLIPADASDEKKALYVRNLASMSVFGAGFLCPSDKAAYNVAFAEAFPEQ
ncbi:hypothetical protein [Microbacterium sp. H1-D42]|uniref:hypothetical protein n=1 Tax=Microbacterium sp. H1-D42 TaxID=2925844 RepID=UPI001F536454|nr:hypothetical protein [Microbacterium sp. H1-D42]UNK72428.1 hypothetical protein MNR00_08345 [Microbacterium sp. H1-D42]